MLWPINSVTITSFVGRKWRTQQLADGIMVYITTVTCTESDYQIRTWWGAPLHRIPWQLVDIYYKILHAYINYVTKYYGQAVVVFDGDKAGASTKDNTSHHRAGSEGRKVMLNLSMKLQLKMNDFLSNKDNKQWFIWLLGEPLATRGCEIAYSIGTESIRHQSCEAVLVGDHTMSTSDPNQRLEQPSGARELTR